MILLALIVAALPSISVTDDGGRTRSTSEWSGVPTIVAPMYARCPLACPLIAEGLKRGTAASKASPSSYRVVLFSFDPRDTPRDLQLFRERHNVPLSWSIVRSNDARTFLDAAGYRYADAKGLFTHPNAVIVLDAGMKPVKTLYGTTYDIDEALSVARGRRDWLGQFGGTILAALLFAAAISAVALFSNLPLLSAKPTFRS